MFKVYKHKGETYLKIKTKIELNNDVDNVKEANARLARNVPWLTEWMTRFAGFDYSYSIELFCDALKHLAHELKRWDNCTMSERNYKRCLFASEQLRRAYFTDASADHKRWLDKNPFLFIPVGKIGHKITHDYYQGNEELQKSLLKIIQKRDDEREKRAKQEAWAYINKYIEYFWD